MRQEQFGYIGGFCPAFGIFKYTNYGVTEEGFFTEDTFTLKPERILLFCRISLRQHNFCLSRYGLTFHNNS